MTRHDPVHDPPEVQAERAVRALETIAEALTAMDERQRRTNALGGRRQP